MDDILALTLENYNKTIEYHKKINYDTGLNVIWANNMPDISNIVTSSKSARELIDRVDQTFMYAINFPPENGENTGVWRRNGDSPHIREKQIDWLLEKQNSIGLNIHNMSEEIHESEFIHDRNKTYRNGRILSGNFLRTLSIVDSILTHLPQSKIKKVIELGAGCGHQARTLMTVIPGVQYTIVDLPETMMFSFTHLSLCFPNKKLLWVTNEEDLEKIDDQDFVFVPAVFAPKLIGRSYDLFINTASMGEMTNPTIHKWMKFIQEEIKVKYLFTLNRFLNVACEGCMDFRKNENECSTSYDSKWKIIKWELEPLYARCPYIDTLHSRYLEIIAERPEEQPDPTEVLARSHKLANDAFDEDWYRLRGYYSEGLMQARINVLQNDMTMTGTLFKFWESIRLNPNKRNVSGMLEYLKTIIIKHDFEEAYYYRDLLSKLNQPIM